MIGVIITPGITMLIRNGCSTCIVETVTLSWMSLVNDDCSHHDVGSGPQAPGAATWFCQGLQRSQHSGSQLTWSKLTAGWCINQNTNLGNITARRLYWRRQVTVRRIFKAPGWMKWMNECYQAITISNLPWASAGCITQETFLSVARLPCSLTNARDTKEHLPFKLHRPILQPASLPGFIHMFSLGIVSVMLPLTSGSLDWASRLGCCCSVLENGLLLDASYRHNFTCCVMNNPALLSEDSLRPPPWPMLTDQSGL